MKLVYLTSKEYPSSYADNFFALQMARAFDKLLHRSFTFVIAYEYPGCHILDDITHLNVGLRADKGRTVFYFFWIPYFICKERLFGKETVFFSNDANLLSILISLRKIFRFNYRIFSDWHMLGHRRDAFVARHSDGLVTTTEHLKKAISEKFGISRGKIFTAYGGADPDLFNKTPESKDALRKCFDLPENVFLVGYAGFYKTLGMSKGIDTMIDALADIPDPDVCMIFIGGRPPEIEEYKEYAAKKGVNHRAFFIPTVSLRDLAAYEKTVDVLVIPYPDKPHFRDFGFPMKTYEYLLSGKPVIFSDLPIIKEMLSDCAISFQPGNGKDLAKKIIEIKKGILPASEIVVRAREKGLQYTWDKRAKRIIDFIKTISSQT